MGKKTAFTLIDRLGEMQRLIDRTTGRAALRGPSALEGPILPTTQASRFYVHEFGRTLQQTAIRRSSLSPLTGPIDAISSSTPGLATTALCQIGLSVFAQEFNSEVTKLHSPIAQVMQALAHNPWASSQVGAAIGQLQSQLGLAAHCPAFDKLPTLAGAFGPTFKAVEAMTHAVRVYREVASPMGSLATIAAMDRLAPVLTPRAGLDLTFSSLRFCEYPPIPLGSAFNAARSISWARDALDAVVEHAAGDSVDLAPVQAAVHGVASAAEVDDAVLLEQRQGDLANALLELLGSCWTSVKPTSRDLLPTVLAIVIAVLSLRASEASERRVRAVSRASERRVSAQLSEVLRQVQAAKRSLDDYSTAMSEEEMTEAWDEVKACAHALDKERAISRSYRLRVTRVNAHLRGAPRQNAGRIHRVPRGTAVEVVEARGRWVRVIAVSAEGWIRRKSLTRRR